MFEPHDITIIAGLSGVGKTYVINALMQKDGDYAHFSAGSLIKTRMASLERDHLRELEKNVILNNQRLMVEQFRKEILALDRKFKILFDAHMLIDSDQGIVEIPYEIFEQILPTRLIFLFDKVDQIIARREGDTTRKRPTRTTAEITKQQERSILLAQKYCDNLGIPFMQIHSNDLMALTKATFVNSAVQNKDGSSHEA